MNSVTKKLLLMENPRLRWLIRKKTTKRQGVHDLNKNRATYGEYHHLYRQLRGDPVRFFQFLRMSVETFDYILDIIKHRLKKKTTNFKKPISPSERLYVTIR